jgi:hypothetical protein
MRRLPYGIASASSLAHAALSDEIQVYTDDMNALGAEYYSELGTTSPILPASQHSNTLYAVADLEFKDWSLNFGVGRGLTSPVDKYTVKSILGFAF